MSFRTMFGNYSHLMQALRQYLKRITKKPVFLGKSWFFKNQDIFVGGNFEYAECDQVDDGVINWSTKRRSILTSHLRQFRVRLIQRFDCRNYTRPRARQVITDRRNSRLKLDARFKTGS